MISGEGWYSEEWDGQGSAISLRVSDKLHDVQSPYQRVEIYQTETFGRLMTLDGLVMVTERDHFIYHEMLTHPALFSRPGPESVLVIGGGDCGALSEVVKHRQLRRIEQVELDQVVTDVALRFFPDFRAATTDPRVTLHFDDGIEWVRQAQPGSYAVIIIDSTDPVGPAEGLFSTAFFASCKRALTQNGVLAIQSESPLFHQELILRVRGRLSEAGFADSASLFFPQCTYPSGWWSATLGVVSGVATGFQQPLAAAKSFATRYYNAAIHQAAFAKPEFLK